jgi:hypothetical protein
MPKTAPRSAALGHQGPQTEQPSIASPDAALQRDKPRTRSESGVRHAQERRFWGEQRGWFRERQQDLVAGSFRWPTAILQPSRRALY